MEPVDSLTRMFRPVPAFNQAARVQFWARVDRRDADGCWRWMGSRNSDGYGWFRHFKAHRVAYALMRGELPEGMTIDHTCFQRDCVNPTHLEPMEWRENFNRSLNDYRSRRNRAEILVPAYRHQSAMSARTI